MPSYEMPLLLKVMSRPEIVTTLKRTAEAIFNKGGFIRKIDNLGKQATPYKISANNQTHKEANYFILHFDVPPVHVDKILKQCQTDIDIVRCKIFSKEKYDKSEPCTLHEELLPPAYRPDVQKMLAAGEKQKKKLEKYKFKPNSGLDYYPFQR